MAEKNQHPGIIGARLMFVVWIRPEDLLGPNHGEDFEAPGKKCLLLVQEMDAVVGRTLDKVIDEVNLLFEPPGLTFVSYTSFCFTCLLYSWTRRKPQHLTGVRISLKLSSATLSSS